VSVPVKGSHATGEKVLPAGAPTSLAMTFEKDHIAILQKLPWYKPLSEWTERDARSLKVKSGLSRHLVRFVKVRGKAFAIKETSAETAGREYNAYVQLQQMSIPTLQPVGKVVREDRRVLTETKAATQAESDSTGYVVTRLLEYAIPDYYLFRRAFTKGSRRRIWDAIVRLLVQLHCKGVYWGDASLSNMMVLFVHERFPEIGIRTVLKAVLADAETVEIYPQVSERLRLSDVEYFLETMEWTEADAISSGLVREPLMTDADRKYFMNRYLDLFEIEREEQSFALITKIDVDAMLGPFGARGQSKALLQHIYEHKWYLSERHGREVLIEDAARDWYVNVFKPVIHLFEEFSILEEFPDRTAASLYLDIMLHKYYLSEKFGKDVGLSAAFESYARQFKGRHATMEKMIGLAHSMKKLFEG
jgi:uncharacterized protein DUF4032